MDWLLPGVPPSGKRIELALAAVAYFENGELHHEHIYWHQASALVQVGLLDPMGLPVSGAEAAHELLDPAGVPSNLLMKRTIDDELL
ncbi:MAG TPA: hypothetical protein VIS07_02780 [Candidatus Binatia bacterium]